MPPPLPIPHTSRPASLALNGARKTSSREGRGGGNWMDAFHLGVLLQEVARVALLSPPLLSFQIGLLLPPSKSVHSVHPNRAEEQSPLSSPIKR